VSTAHEIEEAIRTLEQAERDKLLAHLPQLFPELSTDPEWERILRDDKPRPALSVLLDGYEASLSANPEAYPKVAESDFD